MNRVGVSVFLISLATMASSCKEKQPRVESEDSTAQAKNAVADKPLYAFELNDINGKPAQLGGSCQVE